MSQEHRVVLLIVDDADGHAELVRRNLARSGITNGVMHLPDGREALDFIFRRGTHARRAASVDLLILLDINMPGIDSVEVLRQIKDSPETRLIPVIMLTTTTDDPREIARCYELGCSVCVTKPVDPSAFIDAIRRLGLFISIVSLPTTTEGSR